jgi:hypothetical protein
VKTLSLLALPLLLLACEAPPAPDKPEPAKPTKPRADKPRARGDSGLPLRRVSTLKPEPVREELVVDDETQRRVLRAARAACDGGAADASLDAIEAPVVLVAYTESGTRVGSSRSARGPLGKGVQGAAKELCKKSAAKKGFLHALVVTYTARFPNFGIKGLFDNKVFEPQVTGIAYELGGKRVELDPLKQAEGAMGSKMVRSALARAFGFDPKTMPAQRELTIEVYRVEHIGERYPDRAPQRFLRGHAELDHDELTKELLESRLRLIGDWYKSNVIGGEVTYDYSPTARRYRNEKRTMVRSTMATWILNRLAHYLDDDELKRKGAEVIDFYFERYFQMAKSKKAGSVQPSPKPLDNGNLVKNRYSIASFIASACNERADKAKYTEEMDLLMAYAMSHQGEDGIYATQFGQSQYFMPGQILLAVAYFYRDTKDEKYRAHFDRGFDAYAPLLTQMMHLGPGWYAPYAPAWFTQPAAQMYLLTGEDKYKDLVFAINDRVVEHYEINRRYQVYADYDGMLAPKPNSYGNNSITSASLEALVDAAIVAKKAGDTERFERYRRVIRRATAFLLRMQFTPENTYYFQKRERVIGGFKRTMLDSTSWMDNVWHLTSAFIKIQEAELLGS